MIPRHELNGKYIGLNYEFFIFFWLMYSVAAASFHRPPRLTIGRPWRVSFSSSFSPSALGMRLGMCRIELGGWVISSC